MLNHPAFLQTRRDQIQNRAGETVLLQGIGLGGWMNMENFITGYPANESAFRQVVHRALGKEKAGYFFDRYLTYFFTDADAQFIRSLGLNLVRLPFNYRFFESDMDPFVLLEDGFKYLDRAIEICTRHELYVILDLHAAPGYQNQDWHSDNPIHRALFWEHKHFQDRTVWLWEILADRYKDNPWVAGYDPLNEPSDPSGQALDPFYRRIVSAIRKVDPDHMIFLEGNRYSQDFYMFGTPFENTIYALHNYAAPGFINAGPYPGLTRGEYIDRSVLREKFIHSCQYMLENQVPIWVGEFGPVYSGVPEEDAMRYQLLEDQLAMYAELGANWSLWTYKDIGLQGMVSLLPSTPWMQKMQPVLEKKALLGVDSWGGSDRNVRNILDPVEQAFVELFPNYNPFPFNARWQIHRVVRNILLAEPLVEDIYPLLVGLGTEEIDALMQSFLFENCCPRQRLCQIIRREEPAG